MIITKLIDLPDGSTIIPENASISCVLHYLLDICACDTIEEAKIELIDILEGIK